MDQFDRASELEEQHREVALAAHRSHVTGPSYSHCEDCGEAIPERRQLYVPGCTRCIECQTEHENRSAR